MPFEIGNALNKGAEWISSSPAIYGVLQNPVITALLITALALVIFYAMYRRDLEGTGLRRGLKTTFWLVVAISALVFVHYHVLESYLSRGTSSQGVRNLFDSIHQNAALGGGYAVLPADRYAAPPADGDSRGRVGAAEPPRRSDNVPVDDDDEFGFEKIVLSSTI